MKKSQMCFNLGNENMGISCYAPVCVCMHQKSSARNLKLKNLLGTCHPRVAASKFPRIWPQKHMHEGGKRGVGERIKWKLHM